MRLPQLQSRIVFLTTDSDKDHKYHTFKKISFWPIISNLMDGFTPNLNSL